jgi:choline dehydrogenase-like flavoprotein
MTSSDRPLSNAESRSRTLGLLADTLLASRGEDVEFAESQAPADDHSIGLTQVFQSLIQTSRQVAPDLPWNTLLDELEVAASNQANAGISRPFSSMTHDERTRTLQKWRDHELVTYRHAFQALKRSGLYAAYSHVDSTGTNPKWSAVGYQPRTNPPPTDIDREPQIADLTSVKSTYDIVIVGSGAGGSVAAYELTRAGYGVLVLEQGEALSPRELGQSEGSGNRRLLAKSPGPLTAEGSPILLSGRGLGGGTTVNWMSCLPPSPSLVNAWGKDHGLGFASRGELAQHCREVMRYLQAQPQPYLMNRQNHLLKRGCDVLGWNCFDIPRNAVNCGACDLCQFGCSAGHKRDARSTFLWDANQAGATLMTRTQVIKIEERGHTPIMLTCLHRDPSGETRELKILAHKVILAAGALETPTLLHRSGIRNPHLGQHLYLHPTTIVFGRYEASVQPWQGPPQSVVCNEFAEDLHSDGFRLETVPLHPGFAAMAFDWENGERHRSRMEQLSHIAGWLVLLRDLDTGHISSDSGRPQTHYHLSQRDERRLKRGMTRAIECHRAAGALEVFGSTHHPVKWMQRDENPSDQVHRQIAELSSSQLGLYSAHQMSTCRMAVSSDQGVTDSQGRVFGTDHVYVADASLCPTATGVNPMITVMGLARHVSQQLIHPF